MSEESLFSQQYKLNEEQRSASEACLARILTQTQPSADRSVLKSKGSFRTLVSCTWQELEKAYSEGGRVEFTADDAMHVIEECQKAITGHQRYFPDTARRVCMLYFGIAEAPAPRPRHAPVHVPRPEPQPEPKPEPQPEPKPEPQPTPRPAFRYPLVPMNDKRVTGIVKPICALYNSRAMVLNEDVPELKKKRKAYAILINGAPGIGKSYGAKVLAEILGQNKNTVHYITANSELVKIIGCFVPCIGPDGKPSKEMFYGTLTQAFMEAYADPEHIHIIVLDELDFWPNDVLAEGLYSVLADGALNTMETGRIEVPKNLIFLGIMNSSGMAKDQGHKDRVILDRAILDRFAFKTVAHWDHKTALAISEGHHDIVDFVEAWNRAIYASAKSSYYYGSYRAIEDTLMHILTGWSNEDAVESITRGMSKADLNCVIANMRIDDGNIYMDALKKFARKLKNESDWE